MATNGSCSFLCCISAWTCSLSASNINQWRCDWNCGSNWTVSSELRTSHHQFLLLVLTWTFAVWGAASVSSCVSWSCNKRVVENVWTVTLSRKWPRGPFSCQGELWSWPTLNTAADGYCFILQDLRVHEELQVGGRIWGQTVATHFNTRHRLTTNNVSY